MRLLAARLCFASTVVFAFAQGVFAGNDDWGTVKGRIVLDAPSAPQREPINVDKDQGHCLANGPLVKDNLVVNEKNMGIRWTFVWLARASPPPLAIHPSLKAIKDKQVEMDQPCCQFVPHALAMREGQDLLVKNSAPIAHNVHWTGFLKNPGGNQIVPSKQSLTIKDLKPDKFPVKVNCDIHGWMSAYVAIFDHPYFAVTDEDGKFEIKQAPKGNYRLVIWRESGWGPGLKNGRPIQIKGGDVTDQGDIKLKLPE